MVTKDPFGLKLFNIEQLLNQYSENRYHLRATVHGTVSLIKVIRLGKEKIIVSELTFVQMHAWIQKHLVVRINER